MKSALATYIQHKTRRFKDRIRYACHPLNKIVEYGDCGWSGSAERLIHTYQSDGYDGVVPVDYCPNCKVWI